MVNFFENAIDSLPRKKGAHLLYMQILHTFLIVLGPHDPVLGPSMIVPMGPQNSDQEPLVKRNGLRVLVQ